MNVDLSGTIKAIKLELGMQRFRDIDILYNNSFQYVRQIFKLLVRTSTIVLSNGYLIAGEHDFNDIYCF